MPVTLGEKSVGAKAQRLGEAIGNPVGDAVWLVVNGKIDK
jgi:hypothetical protein